MSAIVWVVIPFSGIWRDRFESWLVRILIILVYCIDIIKSYETIQINWKVSSFNLQIDCTNCIIHLMCKAMLFIRINSSDPTDLVYIGELVHWGSMRLHAYLVLKCTGKHTEHTGWNLMHNFFTKLIEICPNLNRTE